MREVRISGFGPISRWSSVPRGRYMFLIYEARSASREFARWLLALERWSR